MYVLYHKVNKRNGISALQHDSILFVFFCTSSHQITNTHIIFDGYITYIDPFFITISRTPSKLQNMGVWALLYSDVSRCVLSWLCYSNTGMVQEKWGQLFILHSFMKKKCIRIQICHNFTTILKNISIWKTEAPV